MFCFLCWKYCHCKRYGNLKWLKCHFEGDTFEFEVDQTTGRRKVIKHIQTLRV
jgi:recombination protein RecT